MLVLTEGERGASLFTTNGTIEMKSYPIDDMKDTIGAGDAFHSAFLAFLCRADAFTESCHVIDSDVLSDALDFACAAAAINISRVGCSPPTQSEVEDFIQSARS
jgi:fructokinase